MTEAFIYWKYHSPPDIRTFTNPNARPIVTGWDFDQDIIDLYTLAQVAVIPRDEDTTVAVALVRAGFLGASPNNPSFAVSLRTLGLLYTIRLFKPSFSIEAFAKVVTHTLAVSFVQLFPLFSSPLLNSDQPESDRFLTVEDTALQYLMLLISTFHFAVQLILA